eukprot:CAMPEP_0119301196 /NCGR_PEP_ID=MMETSP1333-20130426/3004_1 /TAXON_ID=418940 /ORGANISM="Scyphosphaera apsteinii, Strain RCC1455" /LENGTH=364 /DNA_ID=CAMNT_0007303199 /DNA_START=371 /DNA_END=1462 /DNA_ORIENTATION=+
MPVTTGRVNPWRKSPAAQLGVQVPPKTSASVTHTSEIACVPSSNTLTDGTAIVDADNATDAALDQNVIPRPALKADEAEDQNVPTHLNIPQKQSEEIYNLRATVPSKSKEMHTLDACVHKQRQELQSLHATVCGQSEGLQSLRATVLAQSEEMNSLRATVRAQSEEMNSLRATVWAQSEEMNSLRANVRAQNEEVDGLHATLRAQNNEVAGLHVIVRAQNQEIHSLVATGRRQNKDLCRRVQVDKILHQLQPAQHSTLQEAAHSQIEHNEQRQLAEQLGGCTAMLKWLDRLSREVSTQQGWDKHGANGGRTVISTHSPAWHKKFSDNDTARTLLASRESNNCNLSALLSAQSGKISLALLDFLV